MSDNEGASAPAAASQPAQTTIPRERLDEVIRQNRELQNRLQFNQQQLDFVIQNQRAMQRGERKPDPEMERLKAENPAMFSRLMSQDRKLKESSAALFSVMDKQDRQEFLLEYGSEAKKKLADVEGIIEQERQKGNFQVTRSSVYAWMLGNERLRAPQQAPATPKAEPAQSQAPSEDPAQAATVRSGTASADISKLSFDERRKQLEDVIF